MNNWTFSALIALGVLTSVGLLVWSLSPVKIERPVPEPSKSVAVADVRKPLPDRAGVALRKADGTSRTNALGRAGRRFSRGGTNLVARLHRPRRPDAPPPPSWVDTLPEKDRAFAAAFSNARDADDLQGVLTNAAAAVRHPNADVRRAMVDALDFFGDRALGELTPFMKDEDETIANAAVEAWQRGLANVEDAKLKRESLKAALFEVRTSDGLESLTAQLHHFDRREAVQTVVDVILTKDANPASVAAVKKVYEEMTGDAFTTVEAADQWVGANCSPEN